MTSLANRHAILLCFAVFVASAAPYVAAQAPEQKTVKVVIDFGDGLEKHFTALPWEDGMTVLDAMRAAENHPRGVEVDVSGEGKTAFLTGIDGVTNEGGDQRNWIYRVNEDRGDRSIGVKTLSINDVVYWKFGAD